MGQMGFFNVTPLWTLRMTPWRRSMPSCRGKHSEAAFWRKPADKRKSNAGCKPWDAIVMFKAIVLCALYNLSDDQVEYQMRDRLSFVRFLALTLEDKVPDAKTVWLYREQLSQAGVIEALFDGFDGYLKSQGYQAMGGQIIDASIVAAPIQRNSREENEQMRGESPEACSKGRQKDTQARSKATRTTSTSPGVTGWDASVHDSQGIEELLTSDNTASGVWADSAYRSKAIEAQVKARGLRSRIHRKGYRNRPLRLGEGRQPGRSRVEHVFGAQQNDMGGTLVQHWACTSEGAHRS